MAAASASGRIAYVTGLTSMSLRLSRPKPARATALPTEECACSVVYTVSGVSSACRPPRTSE